MREALGVVDAQVLVDDWVDLLRLGALECSHNTLLAKVLNHGRSLLAELLETVGNGLRLVVLSHDQWLTGDVVLALYIGKQGTDNALLIRTATLGGLNTRW